MSSERVQYRPLDENTREIRLALLEPRFASVGPDHEVPVLSLVHQATTDDWPTYCALSYTWGSLRDTSAAVIDGRNVPVSSNLRLFLERAVRDFRALRNFDAHGRHWIERDAGKDRPSRVAVYWIDAICINQADDLEKSSQVRFMSHIFSNAAKVVAWLGGHCEHSEVALEFLNSAAGMSDKYDESTFGLQPSKAAQREAVATAARLKRALQSTHFLEAMRSLSFRSYWTRAWVFQEIALSCVFDTQILCGNSSLQMADFRKACRWAQIQPAEFWEAQITGASELMLEAQDSICRLQVLPSRAFPADADFQFTLAEHLLEAYLHGGHHATLPHDHVYSFLGISSDSSTCGITSDYRSSVAECFASTAEYFLDQIGAHTLLMCGVRPRDAHCLPSWVPDWSTQQLSSTITPIVASGAVTPSQSLFQCSGPVQHFQYRVRSLTLYLSAVRIDKVVQTFRISTSACANLWKPDFVRSLLSSECVDRLQQRYGTDLHTVILCTMVADQLLSADLGHKRFSKVVDVSNLEDTAHSIGLSDVNEHYQSSQELFADGRQLFITESGYLGYGPNETVEGDTAYVVLGLDVPLILRAKNRSISRLVGAAYIHGAMDGEAVSDTCKWAEIGLQ